MEQHDSRPLIFAHRGLHRATSENTIAAFRDAATAGFAGIETDVRLDRNNVPILFHNRALRDGRLVRSFSRAELSDAVGYEVPELAHALDAVSDLIWDIEVKTADAVQPTVAVLREFVNTHQIMVSSFVHEAVFNLVEMLDVSGALLVCHCPMVGFVKPFALHHRIRSMIWDCETVDDAALAWATSVGLMNMIYGFQSVVEHNRFIRKDVSVLITDFSEPLIERQ